MSEFTMFSLSDEHKMIRDAAREFAQKEIAPVAVPHLKGRPLMLQRVHGGALPSSPATADYAVRQTQARSSAAEAQLAQVEASHAQAKWDRDAFAADLAEALIEATRVSPTIVLYRLVGMAVNPKPDENWSNSRWWSPTTCSSSG